MSDIIIPGNYVHADNPVFHALFTKAISVARDAAKQAATQEHLLDALNVATRVMVLQKWIPEGVIGQSFGAELTAIYLAAFTQFWTELRQEADPGYTYAQLKSNVQGMMDGGSTADHAADYFVGTAGNESLLQILRSQPDLMVEELDTENWYMADVTLAAHVRMALRIRLVEELES